MRRTQRQLTNSTRQFVNAIVAAGFCKKKRLKLVWTWTTHQSQCHRAVFGPSTSNLPVFVAPGAIRASNTLWTCERTEWTIVHYSSFITKTLGQTLTISQLGQIREHFIIFIRWNLLHHLRPVQAFSVGRGVNLKKSEPGVDLTVSCQLQHGTKGNCCYSQILSEVYRF